MTKHWPSEPRMFPADPAGPYLVAEETMTPRAREAVVLDKLRVQVRYAWRHSGLYRRLWSEAGVDPDALETLADLARFPLLRKEDVRRDQAEHPPYGSNLCCDPADVRHVHGTSGTTGRPVLFALSHGDWRRIAHAHARIMWSFGVRRGDTVFIGSLFSLYMGSWGTLIGAEELGAAVLPFGAGIPGQTEGAVELIERVRPTVFYGTPSYALHLAATARDHGVDPAGFGFRLMFFSGEPGAGIPATKRRLEETFAAACVDTGSMAEMTPWMANAECAERTGMHLWDDVVYTEIVDRVRLEPIDGDGEGVPVYTHLERTSQPMIRLFSGDLTRVTSDTCPCGRTYRRLPDGIYGRVDDMLVIRGVNVYPHAIEDALGHIAGLGTEYRIVIERPRELDVLALEVEAENEAFAPVVRERIKSVVGIAPEVRVRPPGALPRTDLKSRRVEDRRGVVAAQ